MKLVNRDVNIVGLDEKGNEVPGEFAEGKPEAFDIEHTLTDSLASGNAVQPEFTQDFGSTAPLGSMEFEMSVVNGHWSFEEFLIDASSDVSLQVEGVAYHDGHIYFGEETDDGSPATIHKYTVDGESTGESFTFGIGEANHTNWMKWIDGELWVSDAAGATDTTYIVDFDAGNVVDTINHNGDADLEGIRGIIPATDGKLYYLTSNFGSAGYGNAHLVDLEGARSDGETAGNIETTLSHDGITSREQSGIWRNGYLYIVDHRIQAKLKMPFADQLRDGYSIMAGENVEWVAPRPGTYEIEDFDYNPDRDEWYVGQADSSPGVHRVTEGWGDNVPVNWDTWDVVSGGVDRSRCLNPDAAESTNSQDIRAIGFAAPAVAEVWLYDHGRTSGESNYISVLGDEANLTNHTLAIKTDETNGDTNYYRWNNTDDWEDTGVARPTNPQWVKFRFHATGDAMEMYISTDLGETWQDAGAKTVESTNISKLRIRCTNGSFKVGTWNVQLLDTPTI